MKTIEKMKIAVNTKFERPKTTVSYQEAVNRLADRIMIHSYWEASDGLQNKNTGERNAGKPAWHVFRDFFGEEQQVVSDYGLNAINNRSIELIEKEGSVEIWRLTYEERGGSCVSAIAVFVR